MQIQEFDYQQLFNANDIHPRPFRREPSRDADDDEPVDDLPPPAWLRRRTGREAFPACEALLTWPANYPVEGDADLSEEEAAEEDASRFLYSEPELEAWSTVVAAVLAASDQELHAGEARPLPAETGKRPAPERALEVTCMETPTDQQQQPDDSVHAQERHAPPVERFSAGVITVSVWSNSAPFGGHFRTFSVDRRYRAKDGTFGNTRSLRLTDLPVAAALLLEAFREHAFTVSDTAPDGGTTPPPASLTESSHGDQVAQER